MKVACEIILDVDEGAYELKLRNLSQPGEPIDYAQVRTLLQRAVLDFDGKQVAAARASKATRPRRTPDRRRPKGH